MNMSDNNVFVIITFCLIPYGLATLQGEQDVVSFFIYIKVECNSIAVGGVIVVWHAVSLCDVIQQMRYNLSI